MYIILHYTRAAFVLAEMERHRAPYKVAISNCAEEISLRRIEMGGKRKEKKVNSIIYRETE